MNLRVFIGYSSVDENIANELARLFDEIGLEYLLDRKDIEWGSHITREIRKGLSECSHVVVIISPASLKSQWVPFEIGHAMVRGKGYFHFLPILHSTYPDIYTIFITKVIFKMQRSIFRVCFNHRPEQWKKRYD